MNIKITTDNCDCDNYYKMECSANSEVMIKLEFEKVVSMQSQRQRQRDLCDLIESELKKFKWIVAGSVNVEISWYLNAIERQETDKVGDLDNITKPLLDSLTGENGILIDDSQIGSIHTYWQSRNDQVEDNIVYIKLSFINDECLWKENLIFIQYSGAVCAPINVDFNSFEDMWAALMIIKARQGARLAAKKIRNLGDNVDRFLVQSSWETHRTRLNGFNRLTIYKLPEFKQQCKSNGLTYSVLLKFARNNKNHMISAST